MDKSVEYHFQELFDLCDNSFLSYGKTGRIMKLIQGIVSVLFFDLKNFCKFQKIPIIFHLGQDQKHSMEKDFLELICKTNVSSVLPSKEINQKEFNWEKV